MELRLSCTNPFIFAPVVYLHVLDISSAPCQTPHPRGSQFCPCHMNTADRCHRSREHPAPHSHGQSRSSAAHQRLDSITSATCRCHTLYSSCHPLKRIFFLLHRLTGLGSNTFYQIQIQIHFFPEFQIQIQIQIHRQKSDQIQIQIQIQLIKYKYKYKYTMRPRQNCGHFTDEILKYIVLSDDCFIHSSFTENYFQRSNLQ